MALLSSPLEIVGCSVNAVLGKDLRASTRRRQEDQCFVS
jgi:hypothetical protein